MKRLQCSTVATALRLANGFGITSLIEASAGERFLEAYAALARSGELTARVKVSLTVDESRDESQVDDLVRLREKYQAQGIRADGARIFADGVIESGTAALLEPYLDSGDFGDFGHRGELNYAPELLDRIVARLDREGFQVHVHAIGDRAIRASLDAFEKAAKANGPRDSRHHIAHIELFHPDDIPRFGQLGVIAAMQGVHATSDGPWVHEKLGEQRAREGAYVWQSLMRSGAIIANGTDAPVEDVSPIASYYSSVSRMTSQGTKFYPDQAMSRMEALRSYTINGAFAAFEDSLKGSLTPGKLADITVLSKDILTIPEEEIPSTEVVYTIVGGKVRYRRPANP